MLTICVPSAKYVKTWLPVLQPLDAGQAHHPWTRDEGSPDGYPSRPVTENPAWKSHYFNGPRRGGMRGRGGGGGGRGDRGRGGGRGGGHRGSSNGHRGGNRS